MSGFNNPNLPFQFNANQPPSANNNANPFANNVLPSAPGLFSSTFNSAPPPPYSATVSAANPFGGNVGFQNSTAGRPMFNSTFSNSQTAPSFRMDGTANPAPNPFQSTFLGAKNVMGAPAFSQFQMPRPGSILPSEQRPAPPFSFLTNVNSPESRMQNPLGNNKINFVNSAVTPNKFSSISGQSSANVFQPSVDEHTTVSRFTLFNPTTNANPFGGGSGSGFNQKFNLSSSFTSSPISTKTFGNPTIGSASHLPIAPAVPSTNLWNQSVVKQEAPQTIEKELSASAPIKVESSPKKEPLEELAYEEDQEEKIESKKHEISRSIRKPSVTSIRKTPGLFNKAVAGIKSTPSVKSVVTAVSATKSSSEKPKEPLKRRLSVRSSESFSPEEIQSITSIVCREVPDDLNNKPTFLQHFGKFGVVKKIVNNPQKQSVIVTFQTHEAASLAKRNGKILRPDRKPMTLFFSRTQSPKSRNESRSSSRRNVDAKRSLQMPSSKSSSKYDENDDVGKELSSMGASGKLLLPKVLDRPKESSRSPKHHGASVETQNLHCLPEAPARTAHDKYMALDNLDKMLRIGLKKQSSLATAKAIIGTCSDMCSEKERYMREDRGQLHLYEVASREMGGDTICDHRKAVKEYSRSSADQEQPLAHELRPPKTLAMTMDYIVCNIMDIFENSTDVQGSAVEWYDFVWNRTRSIRKDIIQQHLSDHVTVDVVEKCARFHIHCSARLCEEDMMVFDQKYNNENLTNCLQTLKHMYADLRAKGQPCSNEAEFVAYDFLLNLNEGNIIRQITVLHVDVQQAPEIKLALACANAISVNNYVRFFKLVRQSSYLIACVLQRYFNQVRIKGFQGFIKAYLPTSTSTFSFPIRKLIDLFGFDDNVEASEFASFHNLVIEGNYVILDRSKFCSPESAIPLKRAKIVIESKRKCSVGELVNNGPLPINPLSYYKPHNSFDDSGLLKRDNTVTLRLENKPVISLTQIAPEPSDYSSSNELLNKASEEIAIDVITETTNRMIESVAKTYLERYVALAKSTADVVEDYFKDVCRFMMIDIVKLTYDSCRVEELKSRLHREAEELVKRQLIEQQKEECAVEILNSILEGLVAQEVIQTSQQELKEELIVYKKQSIDKGCIEVTHKFVDLWTNSFIQEICLNEHNLATEYKKVTLARVSTKLSIWKSAVFFKIWRTVVLKRKRLTTSMEQFPSSILCSSFVKRGPQSLQQFSKLNIISPLQSEEHRYRINQLLDVSILSDDIKENIKHTCINLFDIAKNNIFNGNHVSTQMRMKQLIYWKLIIISGSSNECKPTLNNWLRTKFVQPESENRENIAMDEVVSSVGCKSGQPCVAVSVKMVQPINWRKKGRLEQVVGTQGIVLVVLFPENGDNYSTKVSLDDGRRSLLSILRETPPIPTLPVLLVVFSNYNFSHDDVCHVMNLDSLKNEDCISDYKLIQLPHKLNEPYSTQKLTDGLQWLGCRCPCLPDIRIDDLNHYLNKMVGDYFMPIFHRFKSNRLVELKFYNCAINAFNHVIEHAANCVSDVSLSDLSWPAIEFAKFYSELPRPNWNCDQNLQKLKQLLSSFQLTPFKTEFCNCLQWDTLSSMFWEYIDQLQHVEWSHKMFLCAKLQRLLDKAFQEYQLFQNEKKPWAFIPWIDIIKIFVDYHLTIAPTSIEVAYDIASYDSFVKTDDWNINFSPVLDVEVCSPSVSKRKIDEVSPLAIKRRSSELFKKPDLFNEIKYSCMELKRQLAIEKTRSANFEKYLAKIKQE